MIDPGDLPLSDELARRVIASNFPNLGIAQITGRYEGMDHHAVEVDSAWIFRFPKRAESAPMLLRELKLLPILDPLLSVEIPQYTQVGSLSVEYPFTFAGYRKLLGVPAMELPQRSVDLDDLATVLRRVLDTLQAIPWDVVEALGVVHLEELEDIATLRASTLEELEQADGVLTTEVVDRCRTFLDRAGSNLPPHPGPPYLLHGDLSAEHLILNPESGRVVAIIDWADACLGDPAYDLKFLWSWLGEGFVDRLLGASIESVDAGFRNRVRFYGVCTAVGEVAYGLSTGRSGNLRQGIAALDRMFGVP